MDREIFKPTEHQLVKGILDNNFLPKEVLTAWEHSARPFQASCQRAAEKMHHLWRRERWSLALIFATLIAFLVFFRLAPDFERKPAIGALVTLLLGALIYHKLATRPQIQHFIVLNNLTNDLLILNELATEANIFPEDNSLPALQRWAGQCLEHLDKRPACSRYQMRHQALIKFGLVR